MGKGAAEVRKLAAALQKYAFAFPGAWEDHPWGETVAKVGKKVFVFFGMDTTEALRFSVKLPASGRDALSLPFAEPTGYGLGRAGWVTFEFPAGTKMPEDAVRAWIEESYRAVAPKKQVAELEGRKPRR